MSKSKAESKHHKGNYSTAIDIGDEDEQAEQHKLQDENSSKGASTNKRKSTEKQTVLPAKKTFSIQLNTSKTKSKNEESRVLQKKSKLKSVFNDDSDSEEEEMPLECRMKMRNIGRDTVTSSGPKSFNKGKQGFTNDSFKKFELSMKPRNSMEKQNDLDS